MKTNLLSQWVKWTNVLCPQPESRKLYKNYKKGIGKFAGLHTENK
jgi:hypothetical protein